MNRLGEGFLRAALCAAVLAVMAAFSAASAQGDGAAPLDGIESYLDGIAAAQMGDDYPPGMTVAVATPEAAFVKSYVDQGASHVCIRFAGDHEQSLKTMAALRQQMGG